jgi:superfamily II DNA or RNA helicase
MPDHFTDSPLPCLIEGTIADIVEQLKPVYQATVAVDIFCSTIPEEWALATLGMSNLDTVERVIRLYCSEQESLPERSTLSTSDCQRLGFLGHHLSQAYWVGDDFAEERGNLAFSPVSVILKDSADNYLALGISQFEEDSRYHIQISWSFGDPLRKVATFVRNLGQHTNESNEAAFVTQWIRAFPYSPPFVEEESAAPGPLVGIKLHPHQERGVANWKVRDWRGIFSMCTGAGKTIAALAGVVELHEQFDDPRDRPVTFISVPTQILADQWIKNIRQFALGDCLVAFRSANNWLQQLEPWVLYPHQERRRFVVTTYATFADPRFGDILQRLYRSGKRALWIADEMHNLSSNNLREKMRNLDHFFAYRLGLSATPEIEGDEPATRQLLSFFGEEPQNPDYCATYELADGIRDGVLCRYRYFPVPAYLDQERGSRYLEILRGLEDAGNSRQSFELYEERRRFLRSSGAQLLAFREKLPEWRASGDLERCLVYCPPGGAPVDAEETENDHDLQDEENLLEQVVGAIQNQNIPVCSILGGTSQKTREDTLRRFADGEVNVLCAIACLDEGVDVPEIETAIVLYSVDRAKQFIQRRGRILRIPAHNREKIAVIYDVVLLPHGSQLGDSANQALFDREMRRYREFAGLAVNSEEARDILNRALGVADSPEDEEDSPEDEEDSPEDEDKP